MSLTDSNRLGFCKIMVIIQLVTIVEVNVENCIPKLGKYYYKLTLFVRIVAYFDKMCVTQEMLLRFIN